MTSLVSAQNPYALRCDTVNTSQFPKVILRIGVDSLANPVKNLNDSDFTVREAGISYLPAFVQGSCTEDSLSLMLVMDESGSMNYVLGNGTRMDAAKSAATSFLNRLIMPPDEAALIGFSSSPTLFQNFTTNKQAMLKAVGRLFPYGGTNLADPVTQGLAMLRTRKGKRVLLLMTDGHEDPDYGFSSNINSYIATAKLDSVVIYTIGLFPSNDADKILGEPLLRQLALGTKGMYFWAPNPQQILAAYDSIYYRLLSGYCSASFSSFLCDSGPRPITVIFRRGGYVDSCTQTYVSPGLPITCNCPHVAYSGAITSMSVYPNPVHASARATIHYRIDREGPVQMTLFNMLGAVVATPVNDVQSVGPHQIEIDGAGFPAGIYFYRLVSNGQVITRSLTITR